MATSAATNGNGSYQVQVRGLVKEPTDTLTDVERIVAEYEAYGTKPGENPRLLAPANCRVSVAHLRLVRDLVGLHLAMHDAGHAVLSPDQARRFDALADRIEELIDSFRWGAEAADELRDVIDEELCR